MVALLTQFLWQDKGREKKKVSILNPKAAGWLVQPKKLSTNKKKKRIHVLRKIGKPVCEIVEQIPKAKKQSVMCSSL
jgi:hypothetical protein